MVHTLRHSNIPPWISELNHDFLHDVVYPLLLPTVLVVLQPCHHLIPPVLTVFPSLADFGEVCLQVVIINHGQHLAPVLLVAEDVLVPETELSEVLVYDSLCPLHAWVHVAPQDHL